jgi:hypothetical protein
MQYFALEQLLKDKSQNFPPTGDSFDAFELINSSLTYLSVNSIDLKRDRAIKFF